MTIHTSHRNNPNAIPPNNVTRFVPNLAIDASYNNPNKTRPRHDPRLIVATAADCARCNSGSSGSDEERARRKEPMFPMNILPAPERAGLA